MAVVENTLKLDGKLASYNSGNLYDPITELPLKKSLTFTKQVIQHDTLAAGASFVAIDQGSLDPAKGFYLQLDQKTSVVVNGETFANVELMVLWGEISLLEIAQHATLQINYHAEFYG